MSYFWDDLIANLQEGVGKVIPVVGRDLLVLPSDDGPTNLYDLLARVLAKELRAKDLPPNSSLSRIVGDFPKLRVPRQDGYLRLKNITERTLNRATIPDPLRKLAKIKAFNLFISTTFDPLLEWALEEERGVPPTVVTYTLNQIQDLPPNADSEQTIVYKLMGRLSSSASYAVTDGDILEFVHSLQSRELRPPRLFDELKKSHLLLLGNRFPGWLVPSILRTAKSDRLWAPRERSEFMAEPDLLRDKNMVLFLENFSWETKIFKVEKQNCTDFVDTLYEKWCELEQCQTKVVTRSKDMAPGSIFVSYPRENRVEARRFQKALQDSGLDTWFDELKLDGGDEYVRKIQRNIRNCSLFLPLISKITEKRGEGFFRKEWGWAIERLPAFTGSDQTFIIPVSINDIDPECAQVPDEYRSRNWERAPEGKPSPEFLAKLKNLIRQARKRERKMP